MAMEFVPLYRVFIACPGDVAYEKKLAVKVIEGLQYHPFLRGKVAFQMVAYDTPGPEVPFYSNRDPQESVNWVLGEPGECHIVVVILWSRMGNPQSVEARGERPGGGPYMSGTDWEFWNAKRAADEKRTPYILTYRRTEPPPLPFVTDEAAYDKAYEQYLEVKHFFAAFHDPDGSPRMGLKTYETPSDFRRQLASDLETTARLLLESSREGRSGQDRRAPPELWTGDPFPGLRPFGPNESGIFFGRGVELDGLIRLMGPGGNRFVAVIGESGSGKSSLVAAGLLPLLNADAVEGSKSWRIVDFRPAGADGDPFTSLLDAVPLSPPLQAQREWLLEQLQQGDLFLPGLVDMIEADRDWKYLFFVDQFEELFAQCDPRRQPAFLELLTLALQDARIRVILTLRSDFFGRAVDSPQLTGLLRRGAFPIGRPGYNALAEMIQGPAARSGLRFDEGLVKEILDDTVKAPGALTLMAFVLAELYHRRRDGMAMSRLVYRELGGVAGAISNVAERLFSNLEPPVRARFEEVFQALVGVDERGAATRLRAVKSDVTRSPEAKKLVDAFTNARLLVGGSGERNEATVELAHEALIDKWKRLSDWVDSTRADRALFSRLRRDAREWAENDYGDEYLWHPDRITAAREMIRRTHQDGRLTDQERDFLRTEEERLLAELTKPSLTMDRRVAIGDRLAVIGDPRPGLLLDLDRSIPDIVWCPVDEGLVTIGNVGEPIRVRPFHLARYPVTAAQYRSFLTAPDGHRNETWWHRLGQPGPPAAELSAANDNHPVIHVTWYDAMAYCLWLSDRMQLRLSLPTEAQWQLAATGGQTGRLYPWGHGWADRRANTEELGLGRAVAAGLFPDGAAPCGAADLCGNVWEWCSNEPDTPDESSPQGQSARAARGGAWGDSGMRTTVLTRCWFPPLGGYEYLGFRIVKADAESSGEDHA
jgi:hypothetical protein